MNEKNRENLENTQSQKPPQKPNDGAGFLIAGFVRITDPVTKESIVEVRS